MKKYLIEESDLQGLVYWHNRLDPISAEKVFEAEGIEELPPGSKVLTKREAFSLIKAQLGVTTAREVVTILFGEESEG